MEMKSLSYKSLSFSLEPSFLTVVEQRHQLVADCTVVSVDPFDFAVCHYRCVEEAQIEGEERHGLETVEFAELGLHGFDTEHQILAADAVDVGAVETGLVGCQHARTEGEGAEVKSHFLRAFVDIEEMADAVACAVEVAQAVFPQELTRDDVDLCSVSAFGEYHTGHRDVAFHY